MNYDEIDVDRIVNEVSTAVAQGNYRKATKKESYVYSWADCWFWQRCREWAM